MAIADRLGTSECPDVRKADARTIDGLRERGIREPRLPRDRRFADVDQVLDAVGLQEPEELLEGKSLVADRPDRHGGAGHRVDWSLSDSRACGEAS